MKAPGIRSGVLAAVLGVVASQALAELSDDDHVTESGEIQLDADRRAYEVFNRFFKLGYPPATVMLHAVSSGMSIGDATYLAVSADVDRAAEFYDTALSLLPSLPGWACQAGDTGDRYQRTMSLNEIGPQPTIAKAARKYFDQGRRLAPFPDWPAGVPHMHAPVSELASLVKESEYWYQAGADDGSPRTAPGRVVPVAFYSHDKSIVVDRASVSRIRTAQQRGSATLPVFIAYNRAKHRRISQYDANVALNEIADRFFDDGLELSAVPEWQVGDHHKMATLDELDALIEIPDRDQVPAGLWDEIERSIAANGGQLEKPLLLTLFRSGEGQVWVDSPATVAVAKAMNVGPVPVVMFFHELDRQACGAPSRCEDTVCNAAVAAGADSGICRPPAERRRGAASRGAGGGTPPPPPAASPPPPPLSSPS